MILALVIMVVIFAIGVAGSFYPLILPGRVEDGRAVYGAAGVSRTHLFASGKEVSPGCLQDCYSGDHGGAGWVQEVNRIRQQGLTEGSGHRAIEGLGRCLTRCGQRVRQVDTIDRSAILTVEDVLRLVATKLRSKAGASLAEAEKWADSLDRMQLEAWVAGVEVPVQAVIECGIAIVMLLEKERVIS